MWTEFSLNVNPLFQSWDKTLFFHIKINLMETKRPKELSKVEDGSQIPSPPPQQYVKFAHMVVEQIIHTIAHYSTHQENLEMMTAHKQAHTSDC